jgi:hypothetical protein
MGKLVLREEQSATEAEDPVDPEDAAGEGGHIQRDVYAVLTPDHVLDVRSEPKAGSLVAGKDSRQLAIPDGIHSELLKRVVDDLAGWGGLGIGVFRSTERNDPQSESDLGGDVNAEWASVGRVLPGSIEGLFPIL